MDRADRIIAFAKDIKKNLGTNDPFLLADYYGFRISYRHFDQSVFKAQTIKIDKYPTIISINDTYSPRARKVICAHELGHALLHPGVNHFDINQRNVHGTEEYEANLFAVSLLFDEKQFNIRLNQMSNKMLLSILECNIETK